MATKKKAKPWTVEAHGIRARLYRRQRGGPVYLELREDGVKERRSLGLAEKGTAEDAAREVLREIAEERLLGRPGGPAITFGVLAQRYLRDAVVRPERRTYLTRTLGLWTRHLEPGGRPFEVDSLTRSRVEQYVQARRDGRLRTDDHRSNDDGVQDGTIRNECRALVTVLLFGVEERLLDRMPLTRRAREAFPTESNPRRSVASPGRVQRLMGVADTVDPSGQLRALIAIAWHTGRRIGAIRHLRVSDLCRGADQVRGGLGRVGKDESWAEAWSDAIVWRPEHDKGGFSSVSPMSKSLRAEMDRYAARTATIGEGWLFEYAGRPGKPIGQNAVDWLLRKAETAAGLDHPARSGWHSFRRGWATLRKAMPLADVKEAGGWRDVKALEQAYSQADPVTTQSVVEAS
ncbi:MAG TPA: tyrosine-type recombinase/integrase [Longimicrobiales bacterium]|nr:tyrosine-type recombinase/integrase [Longimicrobiales bacterium]